MWHNKFITIKKKSFFWENWYRNGVKQIKDRVNTEGHFLSHSEIHNKYRIQCTFLETLAIRKAIPFVWREILGENSNYNVLPEYPVRVDGMVKDIMEVSSKEIYWVLAKKSEKEPSCVKKWEEISDIAIDWPSVFHLPFKVFKETKLQSFQFRMLHRVIPCNGWLHQIREKNYRDRLC